MAKSKIRLKDLDKQGINMGPIIDPIFGECPNCKKPITYLGPTNCQHCGTLISFEGETQRNVTETI